MKITIDEIWPPWQQRVVAELDDLTVKLVKLTEYMSTSTFDKLPRLDQTLMYDQQKAMSAYRNILKVRIARFK